MLIGRTSLVLVISIASLGLNSQVTCAQHNPANQTPTVSFYAISELTKPPGAQVTLRGARLANPKDWPASFFSIHPDGSCTSTLVGPRALLTAAHCTPNKARVALQLGGAIYRGACVQSDLYASHDDADWAMCLMESDVPVSQYETVNTDATRLKSNVELLLTGFGCTQQNGTGGNDGNYRIGEANISALPSGTSNYITTAGEVALCFGDSGGPAFLFLDDAKTKRIQVSVNSQVQKLANGTLGNNSYLSSLSTSAALAFIKGWSSANHSNICGVTPNMEHCH